MPLHAALPSPSLPSLPGLPRVPRLARLVPCLALATLVLAAAHAPPAHAGGRTGSSVSVAAEPDTAYRPRRHRMARPKVQRTSSDESTAERDRRLARECRGRPNAGACLGFGG